ncbi:conserved hypothetical protein [Maricaulis maris MCS10]|uniref:DUF4345 domain-containing protein n=2 Tax=Maricaulis maris TaxID=74318 RepID=Q0AK29_MARMM|nr:conserved hypothetical protein [Maricaulis maris MCS10]
MGKQVWLKEILMTANLMTRIVLALAGLVALLIGATLLLDPQSLYAGSGLVLDGGASQLSEIRAPAGLLVLSGLAVLAGSIWLKWATAALQLTVLVFLGYGVGRVASLALDGMPSDSLVMAMLIELGIGVLALVLLMVRNRSGASA